MNSQPGRRIGIVGSVDAAVLQVDLKVEVAAGRVPARTYFADLLTSCDDLAR